MRPLRYLFIFGIAGIFCAFAIAAALKSPVQPLKSVGLTSQEIPRHYFAPERLQAFSGTDFNLRPELVRFLDQLEASLSMVNTRDDKYLQMVQDYTRFTNPQFVTFDIYRIKLGDNYWKIAKKRGYTIDSIVGCNPYLRKVICYQGQRVLLPSQGGSLHQVQAQERLETIALEYAVDQEVILQANLIAKTWGVIPGMWIFIPGAKPRQLTEDMHKQYSKRALFRSPLAGRYTSFVGMRIHPVLGFSKFHNGVDIACPMNTWVGAAAGGTIIAAGWGGALGKYIKIDHHNGYKTVYGHLNKSYVRKGQKVKKGKLIGRAGKTGRVTGPHLHFTIYENGRVVDPMDFLW
ncbi:peptidoglycan DD-metalloendopeptidase family protein [bacterium]|nr:peptidoglycan DD-metalloendopeptidase family protein [bacterium]